MLMLDDDDENNVVAYNITTPLSRYDIIPSYNKSLSDSYTAN